MIFKRIMAAFCVSFAFSAYSYAAPPALSEQIQILAEMVNSGQDGGWFITPEEDPDWNWWFYAATDLDHDGQLEIFRAKRGAEDIAPELRLEELNENGKDRSGGIFFVGGSDVPDILNSEAAGSPIMYYEQSSRDYHYVFLGTKAEDGKEWDFTRTKVALTLHDELIVEELAFMKVKMENSCSDMATRKFFLPGWLHEETESGGTGTPEEIDLQRYADIELARFGTEAGHEAKISWIRADEIHELIGLAGLPRVLASSYKAFLDGGNIIDEE